MSVLEYSLSKMRARGFDKSQVVHHSNQRDELQAEFNKPSLMRSAQNISLALTGIVDGKRSSVSINRDTHDEIDVAVEELWQSTQGSVADEAYDIAPMAPGQTFSSGPLAADLELMYERLDEFLAYTAATHPSVMLGIASVVHSRARQRFANSNGVSHESLRGSYQAQAMFTARDGEDLSSFNYTGVSSATLADPIAASASFARLLESTLR